MFKLCKICLALILGAAPALALPTEPGLSFDTFRITQYVSTAEDLGTVMIAAGHRQGVVDGALFGAFRPKMTGVDFGEHSKRQIWVETGVLKALDVQADYTIARVVTTGTDLSKVFFPKFFRSYGRRLR